ncbi:MAG: peptidase C39 family protein [Elusimicrobia bacterium]|nr:peptidase C39 family protein [Elusimicrobiota bacterium]
MSAFRIRIALLVAAALSTTSAALAGDPVFPEFGGAEFLRGLREVRRQASILEPGVRPPARARAGRDAVASRLTVWRGEETRPFVSQTYGVNAFNRAVMSWNATGEATFEIEINGSGKWYVMGHWSDEPRSQSSGDVDVDTLVLRSNANTFRFRVTPAAGAKVTLVAVATWIQGDRDPVSSERSPAWGVTLQVPQRSQGVESTDPGKICSPTSLSMVLAFHGVSKPTGEVAAGVLDHASDKYGNWSFNTAYAHRVSGMETFVRRMMGLAEIEAEIAAGRPVVLSHRWHAGDLDGAPISQSDGHVIVVVGFTRTGDVVVNDPAARPGSVRRTYKRAQLTKTWLERGSGITYILQPKAR